MVISLLDLTLQPREEMVVGWVVKAAATAVVIREVATGNL
jgi:hypothetical protein